MATEMERKNIQQRFVEDFEWSVKSDVDENKSDALSCQKG